MRKVIVSNGMIRTLIGCCTAARLRTDGWGVSAQENKRLRAGKDVHLAFEAWTKGEEPDVCVSSFQAAYQEYSDKYLLEKDSYHLGNISRILYCFFNANPLVTMPFEIVASEQQIEMELFRAASTIYVVSDKSDAIIRMKDTGDLLSFELKTTGHIGEDFLGDYALDSQISNHVAACRSANYDVRGVLMQVLQLNKLPDPGAVTPKTGKPAACRIAGHGKVRDCWTQHVRWERFPIYREAKQIEAWRENLKALILTYEQVVLDNINDLAQEGFWGRCGSCDFRPFCLSNRQNWDLLVKREREPEVLYSGIYENG